MRVFLEPEFNHIKWETHLFKQRETALQKKQETRLYNVLYPFLHTERSILVLLNFVVAIAVLATLIQYVVFFLNESPVNTLFHQSRHITVVLIAITTICGALYLFHRIQKREMYLKRTGEIEKFYCQLWADIKNPLP